ncbi:unnamed protein product, partial [Iphiclides podalirius]
MNLVVTTEWDLRDLGRALAEKGQGPDLGAMNLADPGQLRKKKDQVETMEKDHKVLDQDLGAKTLVETTERDLKDLGQVLVEKGQGPDLGAMNLADPGLVLEEKDKAEIKEKDPKDRDQYPEEIMEKDQKGPGQVMEEKDQERNLKDLGLVLEEQHQVKDHKDPGLVLKEKDLVEVTEKDLKDQVPDLEAMNLADPGLVLEEKDQVEVTEKNDKDLVPDLGAMNLVVTTEWDLRDLGRVLVEKGQRPNLEAMNLADPVLVLEEKDQAEIKEKGPKDRDQYPKEIMERGQKDRYLDLLVKVQVVDLKVLGPVPEEKDRDLKDLGPVLEEKDQVIIKEKDLKDRDQYPEEIMEKDQKGRELAKDLVVDHRDPGPVLVGKDRVEVPEKDQAVDQKDPGPVLEEKDRAEIKEKGPKDRDQYPQEIMEKDQKDRYLDLSVKVQVVDLKVPGPVPEKQDRLRDHKYPGLVLEEKHQERDRKDPGLVLEEKDQVEVALKDLKDLGLVLEEKDQAIIKEKDPKDRD